MRLLVALLLLFSASVAAGQDRPHVRFGMVLDGPSPLFEDTYKHVLIHEVRTLLERDYEVDFDPALQLASGYSLKAVSDNLDTLLADPNVDIVLCMGVLATLEAAERGPFDKPVLGPFGVDPTLPIYPRKGDSSGVHNFNYLVTPGNLPRDVALMRQMKKVSRVHLVVHRLFAEAIPGIQHYVTEVFRNQGMAVAFVLSDTSAQDVLDQLDDTVEMVYVTPQIRFTETEKRALFDGLAARRLVHFSMLGREEVEMGALAGLAPKSDTLRWFRRLALNIQRTLQGEEPGDLPVLIKERGKLVINMETARRVDWYPGWDLQISADLINEERKDVKRELTMEAAVDRAVTANPELAAMARELDAAEARISLARSALKPRLDSGVTASAVDADTSAASFGSRGEQEVNGELKVTSLLYDTQARAAVVIQSHAHEAEQQRYRAAVLDTALATSERYLNYLKARTLYRVQRENLDLTESHLETARTRRDVGIAGPSEVYRWEAQLAGDKLEAITARNNGDKALYALNQILDEPQEFTLRATVPDMFDPDMRTGFGRLQNYVTNARDFEGFRYFMVSEGLRDAPELARLDALIAAQQQKVSADKRAYYLPRVGLEAKLSHEFYESDTENPLGDLLPPGSGATIPTAPETGWSVGLNFSLPLYSGGSRKHTRRLDTYDLERLELLRRSTAQQVELRIRTGLQDVATASVALSLRKQAAEAAAKNLNLLEDAYGRGVASLIDLLDAQNAALVAQLAAANAGYDYFLALMRFQRASGNFDFFISAEEREAFFARLDAFYRTTP